MKALRILVLAVVSVMSLQAVALNLGEGEIELRDYERSNVSTNEALKADLKACQANIDCKIEILEDVNRNYLEMLMSRYSQRADKAEKADMFRHLHNLREIYTAARRSCDQAVFFRDAKCYHSVLSNFNGVIERTFIDEINLIARRNAVVATDATSATN